MLEFNNFAWITLAGRALWNMTLYSCCQRNSVRVKPCCYKDTTRCFDNEALLIKPFGISELNFSWPCQQYSAPYSLYAKWYYVTFFWNQYQILIYFWNFIFISIHKSNTLLEVQKISNQILQSWLMKHVWWRKKTPPCFTPWQTLLQ